VYGEIFESGKKMLQIQKYPGTCGQGQGIRIKKKNKETSNQPANKRKSNHSEN